MCLPFYLKIDLSFKAVVRTRLLILLAKFPAGVSGPCATLFLFTSNSFRCFFITDPFDNLCLVVAGLEVSLTALATLGFLA
jgi:hypothetical protein